MASQNDSIFRECWSTTRSPYLGENYYSYWKIRTRIYLQALDYEIQEIINNGPFMPTIKDEEEEEIPKRLCEQSEAEKKKAFLNSKAMFCALDKKEFHRVLGCSNAYEINRYTRKET